VTFKLITGQADRQLFSNLPRGTVFRITEGGAIYVKVEPTGYGKAGYPANAINLSDMNVTNVSEDRQVYPTTIAAREVQP